MFLAKSFEKDGIKAVYPGLESHPSHKVFSKMMNQEYGYGGMVTIDVGTLEIANKLTFGLASYAFTQNAKTASILRSEIQSGLLSILQKN